jgi:hypothetical protein
MVAGGNSVTAINGCIEQLRIWSGVELTTTEFAAEMDSPTPVRTANLYDAWPLISNAVGANGHNWTVNGTVTWEAGPLNDITVADSGSGTDSLAGVLVTLGLSDTGAGAEAFGAAAGALDTASLNVEAVEALAAAMRTLVRVMGAPGMGVEPGSNDEERISTMSAAIGKIASAISDVVATIREVVAFGGSSDVQFLNGPARDWVMAVFGSLTRLAQDMAVEAGRVQVAFRAGVAQELQAMAAVLGTSLGIMKSVLDIVAVLLSDGRETAERLLNDLAARSWIVALTAGLVDGWDKNC